MKTAVVGLIVVLVFGTGIWLALRTPTVGNWLFQISSTRASNLPSPTSLTQTPHVIADHLEVPWGMAFLPDGRMLVTERPGRVRLIAADGQLLPAPLVTLTAVNAIGEGGLLGIAVHPNVARNNFVYLYYTYGGTGDEILNRVVRMTLKGTTLVDEKIIIDAIPGNANHDGGRIKFGPDGLLYVGTGDSQKPSLAQDKASLAGKILRVTDAGQPAPGNPFGTPVYSLGHRNVQGLAWDASGQLWATEHGPSGLQSGLDELNFIKAGQNYGWPTIQGDEAKAGLVTPARHSGAKATWAPSGMAAIGNELFFAGLRGAALFHATVEDGQVQSFTQHFLNQYGRIRDVALGSDGLLYFSTSNRDGRGKAAGDDDRILRIDPQVLR